MSLQFSHTIRHDWLDRIEALIGVSAILEMRTGAPPADCAAAATGTLLSSITLPSDWMAAAASGAKEKSGTWQDTTINATGTPGHFRIYESTGTTCHMQGTASLVGLGGDLEFSTTPVLVGELLTVTTFTLTAPGA